jgi:myo-inositol-1(or 4)-monophosphatase
VLKAGIPIRRFGSAALDLSYVAAGRFDAYYECLLHPWDMAAGKLIVEEAGGKVTDYANGALNVLEVCPILASNGHLHSYLLDLIGYE